MKLEEITVNVVSIFELQVKTVKPMVPAKFVAEAIKALNMAFKVGPPPAARDLGMWNKEA